MDSTDGAGGWCAGGASHPQNERLTIADLSAVFFGRVRYCCGTLDVRVWCHHRAPKTVEGRRELTFGTRSAGSLPMDVLLALLTMHAVRGACGPKIALQSRQGLHHPGGWIMENPVVGSHGACEEQPGWPPREPALHQSPLLQDFAGDRRC